MNSINKSHLPESGLSIETLMEALFYRDEFLSIASHELKTPLTTLKLHAQVFKRYANKMEEQFYSKEKVDRLIDQFDLQTTRLVKLVDCMLDVSRIRSGKFEIQKDLLSLSDLLNELLVDYKFEKTIAENITIYGDQARLRQVFNGLFDNAKKYGKGNPVEVKLLLRKKKILFSVADKGVGISPKDQERIFERFNRGIPASEVSGFGLGLFVAKEIIEAHDGKISVKSELNKGSTFLIEFNRREPHE